MLIQDNKLIRSLKLPDMLAASHLLDIEIYSIQSLTDDNIFIMLSRYLNNIYVWMFKCQDLSVKI